MAFMRLQSLSSKLIVIFITITLLLLIILITVSNYAKHVVLSQVAQSYQNLVNSNIQMLDKALDDTGANMFYIVNHNENFHKLGIYGLTDSEYYFAQMDLEQKNSAFQSYFHNVDFYFIYSVPNKIMLTTEIQGASSGYKDSITSTLTKKLENKEWITGYYYKWNIIQIDNQYYLYRIMGDDLENNVFIGALINVNSLKMSLSSLDLGKNGEILFAGDNGKVLTERGATTNTVRLLPSDKLLSTAQFSINNGIDQLLVVNHRSQRVAMNLLVILPNADLLKGLPYFQTVINIMPIFVIAILLLYLFLIRRLLLKPIHQLLKVIRKITSGDMNARLPATDSTDFSIIHQSFNSMVEEITHLKIDVYEERLRAQKAELKHLQMQINPHFLINTLNVVFQLADMKRFDLVKKTIHHLVQYFRFMMTMKRDTITLDQELMHIRSYLEIQKMRYQDSFDFHIQIQEDLGAVEIPSLIVQPFVENAMIHGFSVKDHPFLLKIAVSYAKEDTGIMQIEIRDNGNGFSEVELVEFQSDTYASSTEELHIGIWNVKKRLSMRYHDGEAGIRFSNVMPHGALVQIFLPLDYPKEEL